VTERIGVMGGTFDPIHHGHLVAASEVAHELGLDRVLFVPTGSPWQKSRPDLTDRETRYLMTAVATAEDPRFCVSRVDIDRPGPTYAVDTLTDLRRDNPDSPLYFITGADVLSAILTWRDSSRVLELAHFVGVTRPNHAPDASRLPPGSATILTVPALAISSTQCRDRVRAGRPLSYLVPVAVERFIAKTGLYLAPA
jgi:nicotinate-nucleotide adenylyltransferase